MLFRRFTLVITVLIVTTVFANAQDSSRHYGTTIQGKHAKMLVALESSHAIKHSDDDASLVTIFSNLASKYPKGEYWCCSGYNVMGPTVGEQWMAAAFTPQGNHTATTIQVAVGYSEGQTNGVVISLNSDNQGQPGKALKTWNASSLPRFGTCCVLVTKTDNGGIPLTGGKQYWVVLSTNSHEADTVDGWNVDDTNQIDNATLASFTNNKWTVFQISPGVAFAVKGTN